MKLTPRQQAVVDHPGGALIVSASAGSGKTEVLARRCAALVTDSARPCGVEQLLVVTFTRAAAAEMRARIARELRRAAEAAQDRPSRARLRREAVLVDAADIDTIDAWSQRIVRAHASEIGVDPAFGVMTPEDATILRQDVLDGLMNSLYASDEPLAREVRGLIARHASADDAFLREMVGALGAYREHVVNPQVWLAAIDARCARPDPMPLLAAALAAECEFQHAQLEGYGSAVEAAALAPYRDALAAWARRLRQAPQALLDVVAQIDGSKCLHAPKSKHSETSSVLERVRERWFDRRLKKPWSPDKVGPLIDGAADAAALLTTVRALEERYHQAMTTAKQARAMYAFADVLRLALDLLGTPAAGQQREPTPIALALRRRYEHVLVDECQDTSPVQLELLRLVSRPPPGGNRLLVGDVKQSIYGFREAEPELFVQQVAAMRRNPALGDVLPLTDNFRSHAGVLDPLNAIFARLFDPALGGTAFDEDERIRAARSEIANPDLDAGPRVELHIVDRSAKGHHEVGEEDVETIEREAQRAAERIQELLRCGTRIPERTTDGTLRLRALRPGDIAILLRKARGFATNVARVLRANGLRCVAAGRETLLDALEVLDVVNVLRLLVNRRHDVALAAYLRGPMVGLSAAELLRIRTAAPRDAEYLDAVEAVATSTDDALAPLAARVRGALAQLDRWAALAREVDVAALVRTILKDTDHVFFALALRGGPQRVALIEALQALAVAFDRPAAGVGEFVAQLDALNESELLGAAATPSDEDAIRVLTIHGAKGLEFPVVFLLGTGTRFNETSAQRKLMCDAEFGAGLKWYDAAARRLIESAERRVISRRTTDREREEELRLLYVAATRARELLCIYGTPPDDKWGALSHSLAGWPIIPLVDRMGARTHLDWLLMATASAALPETMIRIERHDPANVKVARFAAEPAPPAPVSLDPDDHAWVTHGAARLAAPCRSPAACQPAVWSVSALKRALRGAVDDDPAAPSPAARLENDVAALPAPRFTLAGAEPDGRAVGTAFHRFMQLADLRRLESPAGEIERLVVERLLGREEAARLAADDIAWLADSEIGRVMAAHAERIEREVAFVLAVPVARDDHVILRGVIDALVETDAGLLLIDYKTDCPHDESELVARIAVYERQVQLYAAAIERIRGRPVARRVLAFVRARRQIEVRPGTEPLALVAGAPALDPRIG